MSEGFTGGCACGEIRYRCEGAPVRMSNCHCRDCQQATGSAYFPAVVVKAVDFELTAGTPSVFERPADSGTMMQRAFCPSCGSPVFLINGAATAFRAIYAGSLDDPSWYDPIRDIYAASAQPWDLMNPDLKKHDGMPER